MPKRIQRRRTAGWKMPAGAMYVGRPTKFGNPTAGHGAAKAFTHWLAHPYLSLLQAVTEANADGYDVVILDDGRAEENAEALLADVVAELRGLDLCCWCSLEKPCHADALLEFANR